MLTAWIQLLQAQSQQTALKLEYMRKRDEREEREINQRKEADKAREARETESQKNFEKVTRNAQIAADLLSKPDIDPSVKRAAGDYLKQLFAIN
jgi:DNA-binding protein H-NS